MCKNVKPEPDTLTKKRYFNYDLFCTEFTIYSAADHFDQSNPFLFAQSFSDRIKAWWPTNIGLDGFLNAVNFISQVKYKLSQNPKADLNDNNNHCDVYLYLNNYRIEHVRFKDPSELNMGAIENVLESDWAVRLFRIAMPNIDFYYDVKPFENGIRRAGIVTNLGHDNMIYDLIDATHAQYVQKDAVKDIVKEILSCMC